MLALLNLLQELPIQPCPSPVVAMVFFWPLSIAYLVHLKNTRALRTGIWVLNMVCLMWTIAGIDMGPLDNARITIVAVFIAVLTSTRWAFSRDPPFYHPLPRQPRLLWLRRQTWFNALNLTFSAFRHVGIAPSAPLPLKQSTWPHTRAVFTHAVQALFGIILLDLATYPTFRLAPKTFGSMDCIGGDFDAWCLTLAQDKGVPLCMVRAFFTVCLAATVHAGITFMLNTVAMICVGLGVHIPEEWPGIDGWAVASSSVNDFWGHRWHQFLRDMFIILAKPFETVHRALYIMIIFFLSAIVHIVVFYPRKRDWAIYSQCVFYLGSGLACIAERGFKRVTGRRVKGVWGRIWTWTVLYAVSQPMVSYEYGIGWLGAIRGPLIEKPETSLVVLAAHWAGWGPSVGEIKQSQEM